MPIAVETFEVSIDGGPKVRAYDLERSTSEAQALLGTKVVPRPGWTYVDPAGHLHAYRPLPMGAPEPLSVRLPTLKAREVKRPCNGTCGGICRGEGYHETEYRCIQCNYVVEPEVIVQHDVPLNFQVGDSQWSMRLVGWPFGEDLSRDGEGTYVIDAASQAKDTSIVVYKDKDPLLFGWGKAPGEIQVSPGREPEWTITGARLWPVLR
jgi:hypothetical protein